MALRRKCPVCGTKQWHKEPASGLITCSEGHVLQNYRNETREVTELGPHAVRKRNLKSGRKKKERQSKADPKLYHGERARFHYFQCMQVILRMQITALTQLWELPPEFELVCRDIWALHLALLPNPPSPEPLLHAQDGLGDEPPSTDTTRPSHEVGEESDSEKTAVGKDDTSPSSSSSGSDSESSDPESDAELDELMRANSETPSSDEDELEGTPRPKPVARAAKKRRTFGQYDVPAATVSCLVLACWTLRLPVMYMDFVRLVESYDLPYLDALRLLPENMTQHLRKHTVQALSPHFAPTPLHLHRLSSRLARLMYTTPPTLTSADTLAPPATLYILTKQLARLVSIPLTLHRCLAPALAKNKERDPTFHKQDSAVPEVALAAAVIVVLKMVYGLDGQIRRPREKDDPACALPALPELIGAIRNAERDAAAAKPPFSTDSHRSALDMDDDMLDGYLRFCEKALLPRDDRLPPRNVTTDHFPLPQNSQPSARLIGSRELECPKTPTMKSNPIDDSPESLRPGQDYPIYNTQDILGTIPGDLELVVARAASWAGVEDEYVLGVVERFERRVVRWWENLRRRGRGSRASESE
ncbi:hypothetical protein BD413DRAFT_625029 [Trametes elegans]|nr:hypothetical protein BD413DRAFT_625029 [Trametes elegans]